MILKPPQGGFFLAFFDGVLCLIVFNFPFIYHLEEVYCLDIKSKYKILVFINQLSYPANNTHLSSHLNNNQKTDC